MVYAVKQDIIDRYGEDILLTSFDPDNAGTADDDLITQSITSAQSEVDSYIGAQYDVPLATVPEIVIQVVIRYFDLPPVKIFTIEQADPAAARFFRLDRTTTECTYQKQEKY